MTKNDGWRCPKHAAALPSNHQPQDTPSPYPTGARVGLVREHAALGCNACQNALDALDEFYNEHPDELQRVVAERHARTRDSTEEGLGATSRGGRDSSLLAFATDGGDRE